MQLPSWQTPPVQTPLKQLAPLVPHSLPSRHLVVGAHEPPQSRSVSVPFLIMSVQDGGVQVPLAPQTPLTQSPPPPQPRPLAHLRTGDAVAAAQEPPQSTAVSVPFLVMSVHDGAAQVRAAAGQTPLTQSVPTRQVLPATQTGHAAPPQSMSTSVPFLIPSVQLGA